jgi:deoxyribose-phosphate aldolase
MRGAELSLHILSRHLMPRPPTKTKITRPSDRKKHVSRKMTDLDSSPTESEIYIRDFLSANPSLDAELGDVEVMTDRYTNKEWAEQIKETQDKVLREVEQRGKEGGKGWKYGSPGVGDGGLAKTMDHTVLKLDAKDGTIDSLCAEARVEGFKVGF